MERNMKRRLQAQRKFAQGAYIPPNQNRNEPSKNEVSKRKIIGKIIHNNLPANNLLDIVSFQNMHKHLQPFVLLERLEQTKELPIQSGKENHLEIKPSHTAAHSAPVVHRPRLKLMGRNSTMCLRSRKTLNRKLKPKRIKRSIPVMRFKRSIPIIIKPKNKREGKRENTYSTSDLDDEKPLKYLKNNNKVKSVIEVVKRTVHEPTKEVETVAEIQQCPEPTPSTRVTRSTSCNENITIEVDRNLKSQDFQERNTFVLSDIATSPEPEPSTRVTRSTSCNDNNTLEVERNLNSQDFIERRPFVLLDVATSPVSKSDEMEPLVYCSASEPVSEPASQFYGWSGINEWMDSNKCPPLFKIPVSRLQKKLPNRLEKRPFIDTNERRRNASPCPSENLTTIKDVVSASKRKMAKRCHTCTHCGRVDKITQISTLMQGNRPTTVANNDIYEFDADEERSTVSSIYHASRNSRPNAVPTTTTRDGEDDILYLDMLPANSPHIIEMRSKKIANSNKRMMSARLILKTKTQGTLSKDLSLIDHENLLDQLLATLIESAQTRTLTSVSNGLSEPINEASNRQRTDFRIPSNDASEPINEAPNRHCTDFSTEPQPSTSRPVRSKPIMKNSKIAFPKNVDGAKLVDAPTFVLTEAEFNDPIAFFEKITPAAAKFGLCKVVAPKSFQPKCVLNEEMKFQVANQYIARLYSRWGPAAREMTAIKAYLATQNVNFTRAPLLEGQEVNLPKLYLLVQRNGGLKQVIEKKRWGRVAEEMRLSLSTKPERTLDRFYVKYLLPYDTLSNQERQQMLVAVEKSWNHKNQKLLEWALNPLHRQKKLLDESDSSEDDEGDDEPDNVAASLNEAEDCVVKGRTMNLATFKKVAAKTMQTYFESPPSPEEVVKEYWRLVLLGTEHVCVNAASIDTGDAGYGFTKSKAECWGKHPWNLKVISDNSGNVLRSLGAVLGVTLPTLHLGMVFSTSCWHRDPHGLPWIEFMHDGPSKIWYGIPNEQSTNFRKAVETLCPTSCQNKSIWLPSDITMIPPNLLLEHNVSLSHIVQNPGEFVIVFPKAYSCSISTGYTESESVYFATNSWLKTVHQVFQEVRASCEPTTFSLEQLLLAAARDPRTSLGVLHEVHAGLTTILNDELHYRRLLANNHLKVSVQNRARNQPKKRPAGAWNVREQDECEICRATLYLSKVTGLTGKKSSVCLQHAIRLLETPKHNKRATLDSLELVVFYPEEELEGIMAAVQRRLFP